MTPQDSALLAFFAANASPEDVKNRKSEIDPTIEPFKVGSSETLYHVTKITKTPEQARMIYARAMLEAFHQMQNLIQSQEP